MSENNNVETIEVNGQTFTIRFSGGRFIVKNSDGKVITKPTSKASALAKIHELVGEVTPKAIDPTPVVESKPVEVEQPKPALVPLHAVDSKPTKITKKVTNPEPKPEPETFSLTENTEEPDTEVEKLIQERENAEAKVKEELTNPKKITPKVTTPKTFQPSEKRPGVLAKMIEVLSNASGNDPVTKDDVLEVLVEAFPDRDPAKMKATLAMQMPSGLRVEKKIILGVKDVRQADNSFKKGYWIDAEATKEYQSKK